jgi:prepilin-type processing-associated H-X9-DG protein
VVLVLVGILSGLSYNAVHAGLVRAKQAACASNLRQMGTAIMLYAAENNGRLPQTSHSGDKSKSWIYSLAAYLDDVDKVRICPADPFGKKRLAEQGTSYTLNSIVFNPSYDGDGNIVTKFDSLLRIPKPSRTLLAFVVSDQKFGIGADHTHSEEWRNWVSVLVDITPDRFRPGQASTDRTEGRSNYLYADGHVESMDARKFKTLIDQGINPAMPPE